jgi:hypothetical protein
LVNIQASISHILVTIDRKKAEETAQSFGLDLAKDTKNLVIYFEQHLKAEGEKLSTKIKKFLAKLPVNPAYLKENDDDLRNLLAYLSALNQLALRVQ